MNNIKTIIGKVKAIDKASAQVDTEFAALKKGLINQINTLDRKTIQTDN